MIKVTAPNKPTALTFDHHLVRLAAKQTRELPDFFRAVALAQGCDVDGVVVEPEIDEGKIEKLVIEMRGVLDSGDSSLLTASGEPRARSLSISTSAEERAAAWEQLQNEG